MSAGRVRGRLVTAVALLQGSPFHDDPVEFSLANRPSFRGSIHRLVRRPMLGVSSIKSAQPS